MNSKSERIDWQKRVKESHKAAIIALLNEKVLQFKDFLTAENIQRTGIKSPKGLSEVLDRLRKEGLIEKTQKEVSVEGKPKEGPRGEKLEIPIIKKSVEAYGLTKEGLKYKSWWLIQEILDLKSEKALYVHSLSDTFLNFGLSHDIILAGEDRIDLNLKLPDIGAFEDIIMSELFKNIKEKGLNIKPSHGKILLSFEINLDKMTNEFIEIQTFIENILSETDPFSDKRLRLNETQNRLWTLDYFLQYSVLFGSEQFKEKLHVYLKTLSNHDRFTNTFGSIDFDFVDRFVKIILENKDPLTYKSILNKLVVKGKGTTVELPLFNYIKAAKVLYFSDKKVLLALSKYEKDVTDYQFKPDSKLKNIIAEIRGGTT